MSPPWGSCDARLFISTVMPPRWGSKKIRATLSAGNSEVIKILILHEPQRGDIMVEKQRKRDPKPHRGDIMVEKQRKRDPKPRRGDIMVASCVRTYSVKIKFS